MDDQTFLSDPIDVEVARRLAAYAEARLTPSLQATTRREKVRSKRFT